MASFRTPVDICNRALDHCGQSAIDETLGFTETGPRAAICSRVYPKLRVAELERNTWSFAIKRAVLRPIDATTRLLAPTLWSSLTTYFVGSIVTDDSGTLWISRVPDNLNNDPQNSTAWDQYFGPMTVMKYVAGSYFSGELVYTTPGDGTYRVFLSLQNANSDNPATATAWDSAATYLKNQVVTYSSVAYMSRIDFNLNQTPSATTAAANWAVGTTYAATNKVTGSDGVTYQSVGNGNIGHDPTTDGGVNWTNLGILTPWTTSFVGGAGSLKWLEIGGAEFPAGVGLTALNIIYPVDSGGSVQSTPRNIFRLPAGFLRKAPTDPKAGSISILGAPSNRNYEDWNFESGYITSSQVDPIMLRFVADIVDVNAMHAMFCEGLGARIGMEIAAPLTQSNANVQTIASAYSRFMGEARLVNAVLTGTEESALDDFIACRA